MKASSGELSHTGACEHFRPDRHITYHARYVHGTVVEIKLSLGAVFLR